MIPGIVASSNLVPPPLSSYPEVVGLSVSAFGESTSGHSAALPGSLVAGNLLLAWVGFVIDPADNIGIPSGWTLLSQANHNIVAGRDVQLVVAARIVTGSEGGSVNFDTEVASNGAVQIYRLTNWWGSIGTGIAVSTAVGFGGASPNPPQISAPWGAANNLIITGGVAGDDDQAWTNQPTNYSHLESTLSGGGADNGASVGTARRKLVGSTDNPGSFTLASSEGYVLQSVIVRPVT